MLGLLTRPWRGHRTAEGGAAIIAALSLAAVGLSWASATDAAARWDGLATTLLQSVAGEDQLPNSAIPMTMDTDGQGFLWVGTQNGLARWDGLHFRVYTGGDAPGRLPDSQIETVHTDKAGRLWVGTSSGGLARFDDSTGQFTRYTAGKGGLSHVDVHALADAPDGGLWVGTEAGLDRLSSTGRIAPVAPRGGRTDGMAALRGGVVALASNATELWIGTYSGLLHMDVSTGDIVPISLGPGNQPQVNAVVISADGRAWVGTEERGAYVIAPHALQATPVTVPKAFRSTKQGMLIRAVAEVRPGEIWLATYHNGVLAVDAKTLTAHPVRAGNGNLLYVDQNLRALHRAPSGLVFLAGNSAITRYDPRRDAFLTLTGGQAATAVLSERTPVSVFEAADQRIWLGYISHGVDRVDPLSGRVDHLAASANGLPASAIRTFAQLSGGDVLLGSDDGLYATRSDGTEPQRLRQPGRADDAGVQAFQRAGDRLWVAGRDGLWRYKILGGRRLGADLAVPPSTLSDRRVNAISADPNGDLWIATANGLDRYRAQTSLIERLDAVSQDPSAPSGFISSVMTDRRGRLWVSTFGHGLSVADMRPKTSALKFRRIDVTDGLPNSNVNRILEDRSGMIWASTDSGLVRIDPNTFHVDVYRGPEGVPVSSFFYNAGIVTSHGEVLFAGRGGLTVVRPERLKVIRQEPPLVVTTVQMHGRTLDGDPFLRLPRGRALQLPPGAGRLEVGFAALDYPAADRLLYAYRMARSGREPWVDTDATRPLATFTNLAPGSYSLEIRASDPAGGWAPKTLRLPIRVLPAWYQTLWTKAMVGLAMILAVALFIRWRTAHLQSRRLELEAMVEQRTRALRAQTKVLEDQAVQLAQATLRAEALTKAKSDFLANMSHEIRTPLNGVVAVAEMLTRSQIGPKEKEMAEIIRASGDTLQRLLSDILDTARIESGKIQLESAPFHAGGMIRAVVGLSQLKCDEKGVRLLVDIDPAVDQTVMGDAVRVRQVLTNLLSNAVKFTDAGHIHLTAERTSDGIVRLTVADTGVGFALADKGKVLGRFEQADTSITRRYGGSGLGLSICCDLARLMGGSLDCWSEPGRGSRFWIDLPLPPVEAALEAEGLPAGAGTVQEGSASLRILLADDHPTNRKVVELMLEDSGADLVMVENGADAVEAFQTGAFDVILMDMQMPVMDGLTAIRLIREIEHRQNLARTPVIMLTANALPEHVSSAVAAGADMHLSKPFTAPMLFGTLEDALALQPESQDGSVTLGEGAAA